MGANITLHNVCKEYNQVAVVKYVKFEINSGDFLTILGPSGAGKTTLLKMIAGFEETTSGHIYVDGVDIAKKPIHKRNIGMLFQNYALFPHLTVNENIEFPLTIRKMKKDEKKERVRAILEKVKLSDYGKRYPNELSGGQQQRVALARALVFEPSILLLDEPMAALDKQLRKHMQLEIKEIHNELGITTISVTHDQEEALTMATKICVMSDGMVEQISTPVEIYERPDTVFVATFIGEANVTEAEVVYSDDSDIKLRIYGGNTVSLKQSSKFHVDTGNTVNVVIRPEKITVVDPNSYGGFMLKAKIEQSVYIGDVLKIKAKLECGQSIKLKVFTNYSMQLEVGNEITVGISENDMVLVR